MDTRKKRILKAIVDNYIHTAEPIGSKAISGKAGLDLSPATLRSEMSALEESGYLYSPHTSAGRVPTSAGYRFYVNELMARQHLSLIEQETINRATKFRMAELDKLISKAGDIVSKLTNYAALTTVSREKKLSIDRLEMFLSDPFSLVIVAVLEGGFVENKLYRLPFAAKQEDVRLLSETLLTYENLLDINEQELYSKANNAHVYWPYVQSFLYSLSSRQEDVVLTGEAQLLTHPEFQDIPQARQTLEYLTTQQQALMSQLPDSFHENGVHISIGKENIAKELENTSVVMASYRLSDGLRGMIGVIGPTRMDYGKLASRLEYFAKALQDSLLNENKDSKNTGKDVTSSG